MNHKLMNIERKKLLEKLEEFSGSNFEKIFEGALEGFAHYFSKLDINGIDSLLSNYNNYDGVSKEHYLNLINKTFNNLRTEFITSLKAIPGTCNGCIKGCNGYTFIDTRTGVYIDIIIEIKNSKITNFMECYDLKNDNKLYKKERIVIKQFKVNG